MDANLRNRAVISAHQLQHLKTPATPRAAWVAGAAMLNYGFLLCVCLDRLERANANDVWSS